MKSHCTCSISARQFCIGEWRCGQTHTFLVRWLFVCEHDDLVVAEREAPYSRRACPLVCLRWRWEPSRRSSAPLGSWKQNNKTFILNTIRCIDKLIKTDPNNTSSCRGRYPALGHFSFSNFFKLLLAEIWKNKNSGLKQW